MQEMQEIQFWSLCWEDPLEEEMATHSSILAWRIPWTEEPGRLWSKGSQRVGHYWSDFKHKHEPRSGTQAYLFSKLQSPSPLCCWKILRNHSWNMGTNITGFVACELHWCIQNPLASTLWTDGSLSKVNLIRRQRTESIQNDLPILFK